jgi:hypothetical protein
LEGQEGEMKPPSAGGFLFSPLSCPFLKGGYDQFEPTRFKNIGIHAILLLNDEAIRL